MSASDFTKAIARVSEGFCALCDGALAKEPPEPPEGQLIDYDRLPPGYCQRCGVTWWLDLSVDPERPALRTSRALTKNEIRTLYSREGGLSGSEDTISS